MLVTLIGITIVPWNFVCITHPLGHNHHEHNKPTPCEIHKQFANAEGEHILPPMECKHSSLIAQNYEQQQQAKLKNSDIQLAIFAAIFCEIISIETPKQIVLIPPEPDCRSGTIISDSPLRGSPFIC